MVIISITAFFLFRFFIYFPLRVLRISPISAFLCTLISFDIPNYWKAMGDYSLLFGVTLFPLIILLWIQFFKGKLQYFFPFLGGLLFYIHPILAIYTFFLLIGAIFLSDKKVISVNRVIQIIIFAISSSIFWTPLLFKQPYQYTNSFFSTVGYFNLQISPMNYFGLSLFVFILIGITFLANIILRKHSYYWMWPLFCISCISLGLIIVGNSIQLPTFLTILQIVRGLTLIGTMFIFSFGPIFDLLINNKVFLFKIALSIGFSLIIIEAIDFTSQYASSPLTKFDEPVSNYSYLHPSFALETHRIWSPFIDATSLYTNKNTFLVGSYNEHLDPNPVPARLITLMNYSPFDREVPKANLDRLNDYFKVTGTDYFFFDESSPFTKTFSRINQQYINLGRIELPYGIFHVFRTSWHPRNAVMIDKSLETQLTHFPFSLNIDTIDGQLKLDDYISNFATTVYNRENIPLSISYPSETTLDVQVPSNRSSNLIYVNESFDTDWHAVFNGNEEPITPIGPNYMLVRLDNLNQGGVLHLQNKWPNYFYYSIMTIAATGIGIAFFEFYSFLKKRLKSHE